MRRVLHVIIAVILIGAINMSGFILACAPQYATYG